MITSPQNKRVVAAARLKKRGMREKDRRFLVEGAQGVGEALASSARVREVFVTPASAERLEEVAHAAASAEVPVHTVSPDVMGHLTSTVTPQGVVAVADFVDVGLDDLDEQAGVVAVLVEVRDPGNAGTIVRSADASGAGGLVFTESSVDVYNPKAVRATAGSLFHVPVVRGGSAEAAVRALRGRGLEVLAAASDGPASIYDVDLTRPTAVLLGNEARGLSAEARSLADASIRVPIAGHAESLNLAAAATLILFEATRQRAGRAPGEADRLARIVAGSAHDLRSPLTALKGFAGTLLSKWDRLDDQQRRTMLEGLAQDAARMDLIVSQLVDAARLLSGALDLAAVPTDLKATAESLVAEAGAWDRADVVVRGEAVRARVDPGKLRLMVVPMIEGVRWFAEEGPVIIEAAAGPPPTLSVWRAGPTVGPEEIGTLFEPRRPGSGAGSKVGLFVARGLALAHGGSLEVELEGRERLRFSLTLPPVEDAGVPGSHREAH